jgi:hypothetical protein
MRNWVVSRTSGNVALGMMPLRRPGIVVGDLQLLIGAAGAAAAEGELGCAVGFDELFLDHHHCFGGDNVLAVIAKDVEGSRGFGVAAADAIIGEDGGHAAALAEPAAGAAAAEGIEQAAVPCARGGQGRGGGVERIVEDGRLVDGPVAGAGFEADDVGGLEAGGGGGEGEVLRAGGGAVGERLPGVVGGGLIDVRYDGAGRAVVIERGAERGAVGKFEVLRLADEGLLVGAGEDGAGGREVDEGELGFGTWCVVKDLDCILAGAETSDEADE